MLDPVHYQGLRLATRAFSTSPISSLYAEANEPSLEKRGFVLGFVYALRIRSIPQHPTRTNAEKTRFERTFQNKPSIVPPFSKRITDAAAAMGIDPKPPVAQVSPAVAPWEYVLIRCDFTLTMHNKKDTPPEVMRQEFLELQSHYQDHIEFYTDGTKSESCVGCSMIGPSVRQVKRINPAATILTAELFGLLMAVDYILKKKLRLCVVYTESLISLRALTSLELSKNPLVTELQKKIIFAFKNNIRIALCWVPSQVGILGNEEADDSASSAREKEVEIHNVPHRDYKISLRRCIRQKWQLE